ncbi:MAG: NusG domain II-containing protein, partial [Ruminococcus sp.]
EVRRQDGESRAGGDYGGEADCPDKTCVRMGWLNRAAMPVVCLPHHLVIEFADGSEGGVDAVAE